MKKFAQTADLGGGPIYKTDLAGIFNKEMWDAIEGMLYPIQVLTQGAIISGCVITDHSGTTFDMTAGIVYLNGTFMRTAAVTGLAYPQYIQPDTVVNDVRVYANGNSYTIASTSPAKYAGTTPGSGQYIAVTAAGVNYPFGIKNPGGIRIENIYPLMSPTWTNLTLINSWTNGGFSSTVARMRIMNGKFHVSGGVNRSSGSNTIFANITGLTGLSISTGYTKLFTAFAYVAGTPISLQVAYASATSLSLGILGATNAVDYFFTIEFSPDDLEL